MGIFSSMAYHAGRAFRQFWRETRCPACLTPYTPQHSKNAASSPCEPQTAVPLCAHCLHNVTLASKDTCPLCGMPLPGASLSPFPCPSCLKDPPPWSHFAFACLYEKEAKDLILRFKFGKDFALALPLATLLGTTVRHLPEADMCVPMPQHRQRLRHRGFNPVYVLARTAARQAGLPFAPHILHRTRIVPPQEGLSAQERLRNPKGTFAANDVQGKRIVLLDDVLTTGATMRHAAQCLLQHGAAQVYCAVVARTPLHDQNE